LTNLGPRIRQDHGLQAERTALAWTRTSFAVLANGALLTLRDFHSHSGPLRFLGAGLAVTFALSTYLISARRHRTLGSLPLPNRIAPRREVHLVGMSVLTLTLVSALALSV
jgi:uncharacterized membrane protein YidH (DUF202 family)